MKSTCFVFKLKRKKQVLALVLIEDLEFLPLMRNSASFHSFLYAPLVKRRNFSHSWKKSQIFNRDSCKNLLHSPPIILDLHLITLVVRLMIPIDENKKRYLKRVTLIFNWINWTPRARSLLFISPYSVLKHLVPAISDMKCKRTDHLMTYVT